ncbi:hypothetical protein GO013_15695 [Pseudodesulfovibrio sp. JC047]|uniref:hypothetical protein n=1 Tax=Pseudodesulfovibrio sp. JC047 TaxID=2683199 RepID=UPI001406AA01|nr:hypothetical protein [Pseudodesulfovibrio sp. JC047]NDV20854.1 hypothetical protein [Pseudodesulfovibrio sp. JC047]
MTKTTQPVPNKRICAICKTEFIPGNWCAKTCSPECGRILNARNNNSAIRRERRGVYVPNGTPNPVNLEFNSLAVFPFGLNDRRITPESPDFNPFHGPCGKPLAQWPPAQPENKPAQGIVDV